MYFFHSLFIFISFIQIEELYEEILYEILHNVGCEAENETCQSALFSYVQDAFKVSSMPVLMDIPLITQISHCRWSMSVTMKYLKGPKARNRQRFGSMLK